MGKGQELYIKAKTANSRRNNASFKKAGNVFARSLAILFL